MAPGIILFFAVLILNLIVDYGEWIKNKPVNHGKEAWIRLVLLIPSIWILSPPVLWVLLMEFFVYWTLFDGIYNKLRGFDWWFPGSVEKSDAILDKLQRKLGKTGSLILKFVGCGASIFFYFFK